MSQSKSTPETTNTIEQETLLEFPTVFPIKAMGINHPDLMPMLTDLVREHDPLFDPATIQVRTSTKGNYIGLTLMINAQSKDQLDNIYRALTGHHLVKYVL